MWVTYNAAAPYPQPALFGRGIVNERDEHTPPAGMVSFSIDPTILTEGLDERFYIVTAPDVLEVKSPAEVQAIRDADQAAADAKAAERAAKSQIITQGPPPQSVPGLAERMDAVEYFLRELGYIP